MTGPVLRIVAAVVVDRDGRVLVVRKRGTSVFIQPGGKIEPGETAVQALHREVAEELGVGVNPATVRPLGQHGDVAANEPGHRVIAELFMVELDGSPCPAAEIEELAWVEPDDPGDVELAPLTANAVLGIVRDTRRAG